MCAPGPLTCFSPCCLCVQRLRLAPCAAATPLTVTSPVPDRLPANLAPAPVVPPTLPPPKVFEVRSQPRE